MMDVDEHERHEVKAAANRGVEKERVEIGGAEISRCEEIATHHRVGRAPLENNEGAEYRDSNDRSAERFGRDAPGVHRDESVDQQPESERRERRADDVDPPNGRIIATLRNSAEHAEYYDRNRDVNYENVAPRKLLRQPTADNRAGGRRQGRETRPETDRAAPLFARVGGADQRQAAGRQQRSADPLDAARRDEHLDTAGERARDGGRREEHDAAREDLAAAVEVAQRSAQQNQRREEERITFDHPLRLAAGGVKLALKHGQRHVDRRAVDE